MRLLLCGLLFLAPGNDERKADAPLPARVEFNRDIRPILSENCFLCHGPDGRSREANFRLDTRAGALEGGDSAEAGLVPGKPDRSAIFKRLVTKDRDDKMPPAKFGKQLTPRETALVRKWIEQGGEYQGHWAFQPVVRPPVPAVKDASRVRSPIDAFLQARLEEEGVQPGPEADRVTLIRRLSFDLTGLPPTPEETDAFVADRRPEAYEALVERLLASPHHGERMALFWLDLVRFGDTRGYHSDNDRNVGPYRDYVVRAFNDNLPFDRFTTEQLAGDLLPEPTLEQRVASGYNKLNLTTEEGGAQPREYEAKTAADRVRNVGSVWLGATLGCAECHDHKYDPYTMRDFYSLAAFFADVKEAPIGDRDPGILVPTEAESKRLGDFDARLAELRKRLDTPTPELAAAQAEWEKTALEPAPWNVLAPAELKSSGGATLRAGEDGIVEVSGANPAKDAHTAVVRIDAAGATGFRLEVFAADGKGPGRSGNGNFVLTGFEVKRGSKAVPLARATADHSQDGFPVSDALGKDKNKGWAILPHTGKDHVAVFEVKSWPAGDEAEPLSFKLDYQSPHGQHVIGRFRLSSTTAPAPSSGTTLPAALREALTAPAPTDAQRAAVAAHYRTIAPLLQPLRDELQRAEKERADFEKTIRRCLTTVQGPPRTVRILDRGDWMDVKGEVVQPALPGFLVPVPSGAPVKRLTRLDLAAWIVSKDNPLTARTFVNRLWARFYGTGISKRLEDIGGQGEWPMHPALLDRLATDFASDWDVRRLVRSLVTTDAYRRSSVQPRPLREKDPYNRLHAVQSRWRLEAELVRDNALAVSGLLVRTIGGDSVKPYQPAGYWAHLNFPKREWKNDAGEAQWRRGLYTWWQRSFMHPSLMMFDAPNREECCAERVRSNIPQQALVLLNDPTYVEAARVFGARIAKEGGSDAEARIVWGFRQALSRAPRADELRILAELQARRLEEARKDPAAAGEILKVGQAPAPEGDPAELASWIAVARTILNLHETVTRN